MLDFEIKKMLEITEEGDQTFFKIDSIPDRYSINRKGLVFDDLNKRDVGFKVLAGTGAQIDTTTANGRLVFRCGEGRGSHTSLRLDCLL